MLIKSLLKKCETGFDLIVVVDSVAGHTLEFSSVAEAQIVAGSDRLIAWEVGLSEDHEFVLLITV